MYRGGGFAVKKILAHSQPLQNLVAMDFDPVEKLKLGYQAYVRNAGYDPDKTLEYFPEQNQIVNHRSDCTECDEILTKTDIVSGITKPSCAFVRGLMKGIGDCFEKELSVSVVEENLQARRGPRMPLPDNLPVEVVAAYVRSQKGIVPTSNRLRECIDTTGRV